MSGLIPLEKYLVLISYARESVSVESNFALMRVIPILGLNIVVTKVIHHGFTEVKNAHNKIDWLIKVKLCLLHVNGNEVFIEDRTTIIVGLVASFWALYPMISIEYLPYF